MKVFFMSQAQAEKFAREQKEGAWNLISIVDPGGIPPNIDEFFDAVLKLHFLDNKELTGLKVSDTKEIIAFIEKTLEGKKNLAIHCFMGVSRSAAIAKFIEQFCLEKNADIKKENKELLANLNQYALPKVYKNVVVYAYPKQTDTMKVTCFECLGQGCERCEYTGKLNKYWYL